MPDSVAKYSMSPAGWAEFQYLTNQFRDHRYAASLVVVVANVRKTSTDSLIFNDRTVFVAVRQDGRVVQSHSVYDPPLIVAPGETKYAYIVFPSVQFTADDKFYVSLPNQMKVATRQ